MYTNHCSGYSSLNVSYGGSIWAQHSHTHSNMRVGRKMLGRLRAKIMLLGVSQSK
jgi:hypothetical protein